LARRPHPPRRLDDVLREFESFGRVDKPADLLSTLQRLLIVNTEDSDTVYTTVGPFTIESLSGSSSSFAT
jgi:hypothetical protein